jgi:hypothetical protein
MIPGPGLSLRLRWKIFIMQAILNMLMDMLHRFTKGKNFEDDVTLMVIKIL